eukprot:gene4337-5064_t
MQVNEFGFNEPILPTSNSPFGSKPSFISGLSHPYAALFHVIFKIASILFYLFPMLFGNGFIISFIFCTLFLSFDFWTVKNISGRLLVGLRWWNKVNDDGSNEWYFEAAPVEQKPTNQAESLIFWISLYFTPVIWTLFFLSSLISLSFNWMITLSLSSANIYGYFKCAKGNSSSTTSIASNYIGQALYDRAAKFI